MRPYDDGYGNMGKSTLQKEANVARIRDNQRRSRARRKEYLQELEAKYRLCEAVGAEASQEIQTAARKVLDENERLRRLLRQQGFSDANVDGNGPDECASSSSAAETLSVMLATPYLSTSACGNSRVCKTVDTDDDDDDVDMAMDSRQQNNVSAVIASAPVATRLQKQLRPIAAAPTRARAAAPAVAPVAGPRSLEAQPPTQHFPQSQQCQPRPLPQQQSYLSAPSQTFTLTTPQHSLHVPPAPFVQDYPIHAPQPFGCSLPQYQLPDWNLAVTEAMPQPRSYPPQGQYASPIQTFQPSYAYR
ncbi:hypothetical protein E4T50_13824 [Aureobasidium sp. EXF-12298]|nr:hypothetical protein E4T50_13824 [Aureobasidium sp. EXF-12298]